METVVYEHQEPSVSQHLDGAAAASTTTAFSSVVECVLDKGQGREGDPNIFLSSSAKVQHPTSTLESQLAVVRPPLAEWLGDVHVEGPGVVDINHGQHSIHAHSRTDSHKEIEKMLIAGHGNLWRVGLVRRIPF